MERRRSIKRVDDVLVCDEPLHLLLDSLRRFAIRPSGIDGMVEWGGRLPDAQATAILRAVMRVEAELLREDADHLTDGAEEPRSQSARRADALVLLAGRIAAAIPFVRPRDAGGHQQ